MKILPFSLILIVSILLSACAPAATMAKPTDAMMPKTPVAMMSTPADVMLEKTPDTMMEKNTQPAENPAGMDTGAEKWLKAQLSDVNTGKTFSFSDFKGKVVLVETMAIWCPTCLKEQGQVKALHEALGMRDDFVSAALDIDPNENAEMLKSYTQKNGFDWIYAVAPAEVANDIGQVYGNQFLNPPSTPFLIIDRAGKVHPLPFGLKTNDNLQGMLKPFLDQ